MRQFWRWTVGKAAQQCDYPWCHWTVCLKLVTMKHFIFYLLNKNFFLRILKQKASYELWIQLGCFSHWGPQGHSDPHQLLITLSEKCYSTEAERQYQCLRKDENALKNTQIFNCREECALKFTKAWISKEKQRLKEKDYRSSLVAHWVKNLVLSLK